jgi:hypothetical protein
MKQHASDCAVHNMPAYPNGPCDCGADIPKLDLAWEAVNALGGSDQQNNSYDQGFVDAIQKALEAIEKLGGRDPLGRRGWRTERLSSGKPRSNASATPPRGA